MMEELQTRPRRTLLLVALAAAVILGVRLVGLGSFPEIEADEGLWTNSSKNFLLFGDWFMDGRTHVLLSPVFHLLSVAGFALAAPGIVVARTISALAGTLSVLLLYLLVRDLTGRRDLAAVTALLFGLSEWTVLVSRRALIEPLQLFFLLLALVLVARKGRWALPLALGALTLALLTKINSIFILPVAVLFLLAGGGSPGYSPLRATWLRAAAVLSVPVLLAGGVYGALYARWPEQFARAYRFELDGVHFEASSDPILRLGRFGLDPVQASRTIIELFREAPFLMVLASLGVVVWWAARPRGSALFGIWLLVGVAFVLGQMFQPIRYLYLVSPAFAFFAALALDRLGAARGAEIPTARRVALGALALYLAFDLSYLAMNAVANRGVKVREVVGWAAAHTRPEDRIMAAGYLCTDLPNRAYAHYHLAGSPEHLLESIRAHRINYVIYDRDEWRPELAAALAAHFRPVARWPFGVVYQVVGSSGAGSPRSLLRSRNTSGAGSTSPHEDALAHGLAPASESAGSDEAPR